MESRRFPIFATISLLLCLGTIGLWIRSYYVSDVLILDFNNSSRPDHRIQWALASRTGYLDFGKIEYGSKDFGFGALDNLFIEDGSPHAGISFYHFPKPDDEIRLEFWWRGNREKERLGFTSWTVVDLPTSDMGGVHYPDITGWWKTFPEWFVVLLTIILPICRLPRVFDYFRSRRRCARGLCPNCSYNLCAHKPGDNCPECGTQISAGGQIGTPKV